MTGLRETTQSVFVDGHVHIYPLASLSVLLAAVLRHAGRASPEARARTLLLLADPGGVDGFARVGALDGETGWALVRSDRLEIHGRHSAGHELIVVKGRQVVTREGLEVLAVGDGMPADGATLARTLERVRASDGWAVIAWGVGKWLGRRGRIVRDAIRSEAGAGDVALGDNGGRPRSWSRVREFELAAELGMRILAGSDPLPIAGDERRIASYGFALDLDSDGAWASALKRAIADPSRAAATIGERVGAWRCVANQLRLRIGR